MITENPLDLVLASSIEVQIGMAVIVMLSCVAIYQRNIVGYAMLISLFGAILAKTENNLIIHYWSMLIAFVIAINSKEKLSRIIGLIYIPRVIFGIITSLYTASFLLSAYVSEAFLLIQILLLAYSVGGNSGQRLHSSNFNDIHHIWPFFKRDSVSTFNRLQAYFKRDKAC